MALSKTDRQKSGKKTVSPLWFERVMALLALLSLGLVVFDLTYIPLRDFWLQGRLQIFIKIGPFEREFPSTPLKILPFSVTPFYDWVKAIEPYRETEQYLQKVDELNNAINATALQNPDLSTLNNTQKIDNILTDLQEHSIEIIDTNPFLISGKTGTLERIKNKMRDHVFKKVDIKQSSKEAFKVFWSREYLYKNGYLNELNFFNNQIRPLMETNYYRPVGENGQLVDNFGLLDFPFAVIFFLEFLARTWYISRSQKRVSWTDAMLWRWYDIFLFIPVFRLFRVIPVVIRLNQAQLINLKNIENQARQGFVATIAEDITEVVIVSVIEQIKTPLTQGEITRYFSQKTLPQYIDINDTDEISEIVKIIIRLTIKEVLPKLRPDVEALINYNIDKSIKQSSLYQGLQYLPGLTTLQDNLTRQVVKNIYQIVLDVLANFLQEDPQFDKILQQLIKNFRDTLTSEIQAKESLEKIESLLADFLEEIKINYVQRLSQEDINAILEQTRTLRQER